MIDRFMRVTIFSDDMWLWEGGKKNFFAGWNITGEQFPHFQDMLRPVIHD